MRPGAERELVLLKIRAPPGPTRTEVMQLIDIFRARVVDVSDRSLTIAVTGDSGKVRAPLCIIGSCCTMYVSDRSLTTAVTGDSGKVRPSAWSALLWANGHPWLFEGAGTQACWGRAGSGHPDVHWLGLSSSLNVLLPYPAIIGSMWEWGCTGVVQKSWWCIRKSWDQVLV